MSHNLPTHPTVDELASYLEAEGGTDSAYLRGHFPRYMRTKVEIVRNLAPGAGQRMLDVGGHWLHQAALYAVDGFKVTSVDMAPTFSLAGVQHQARELGIELVMETNLENPTAMAELAENSFDLILFSEIIEHITFNPVYMWKVLYRLLAPKGRIVVTTPNYYAWRGRAWDRKRLFRGGGGGLPVAEILGLNTYAHHWKEFSKNELIEYFQRLSPDFQIHRAVQIEEFHPWQCGAPANWLGKKLERHIPSLRPNLHIEIDLPEKREGITLNPGWS